MQQSTPKSLTERSVFKYRISELMLKKYGVRTGDATRDICDYLDITRATYSKDKCILGSSAETIPQTRLIAYSKFFDCEPEDLINHD